MRGTFCDCPIESARCCSGHQVPGKDRHGFRIFTRLPEYSILRSHTSHKCFCQHRKNGAGVQHIVFDAGRVLAFVSFIPCIFVKREGIQFIKIEKFCRCQAKCGCNFMECFDPWIKCVSIYDIIQSRMADPAHLGQLINRNPTLFAQR